jgi:hypothetical protein
MYFVIRSLAAVLGAGLAVAAGLAFVFEASGSAVGPASGRVEAAPARCGKWAVPARIAGKAVCLRELQTCKARLRAQYRRYGFACSYEGRLLARWSSLRKRPLVGQRLEPGAPCPVTTETGQVGAYPGLGPGPAYPWGTHSVITMRIPPPEHWGREWSGTKRVWLLDNRYVARALVRGHQLDGPNEVRFVYGRPAFTPEKTLNPVPELQLDQFRDYPSLTRLRTPGCYAYQVDGRTFSYLVVFEARLEQ